VAPALRATSDGSPLATLVRLFTLQVDVPRADVDRALPGLVEPLVAGRLLVTDGSLVRALVDVRPYGDEEHDWWVVCDATPGLGRPAGPMDPQHVLGISEASSSLAQLVVRNEVGSALDLGTGCGVQALHLTQNPRALAMARLTAALNGVEVQVRDGSLYEPVADQSFDLIATNPPFVVSPPEGDRLVYRETGLPLDDVVRQVVSGAGKHLNPGGRCHVLGAWAHLAGQPWDDRLAGWIDGTGLDAWVVQREVLDLPTYTEMWLADMGSTAGPEHTRRYDRWLSWFAEQGVEAMGFGWINLRRAGREVPDVRLEDSVVPLAGPVSGSIAAHERAVDALTDRDPLETRWQQADGLVQDTHGRRRRAPRVDRAAPDRRTVSLAAGRHGRGGAGGCLRRRPDRWSDPRRRRLAAGPSGPARRSC
jgi:hypothetical protein